MFPFFSFRFCLQMCAVVCLFLLAGRVEGADRERRSSANPSFDVLGEQVVYVDQVTPLGAVLPTTSEIWIVFADGLGKKRLTSGHNDTNPRFSPDGDMIVFERDLDGDIWTVDVNGENVRNVTRTPKEFERDAHFSNDADSLFFLAPSPSDWTEEELAKEPMLALGTGTVVMQLDLKSGRRRQLLSRDYMVRSVFPDPDDSKVVLVVCDAVSPDGKPMGGWEKGVVAVPLDGSVPRLVFSPPKGFQLEAVRSGGKLLALRAKLPDQPLPGVFLLFKANALVATETDLKKVEKLFLMGDMSCEGKTLVGTGSNPGGGLWGIVIYDIASGTLKTIVEEQK